MTSREERAAHIDHDCALHRAQLDQFVSRFRENAAKYDSRDVLVRFVIETLDAPIDKFALAKFLGLAIQQLAQKDTHDTP